MLRTRLFRATAIVGLITVVAALCALAQERENKTIQGTVISVDLEDLSLTVRGDETGQVLVMIVGWNKVGANKWVRADEQIAVVQALKPGDKIEAVYRFGEERWIMHSLKKLGGTAGGDVQELQEQVAAMQEKLAAMEKKIDTIEALVRQLAAK